MKMMDVSPFEGEAQDRDAGLGEVGNEEEKKGNAALKVETMSAEPLEG